MSERDRAILDRIGIPMARIAAMLGVTRQSLHQGVGRQAKDYLDASSLTKLHTTLASSTDAKERAGANTLKTLIDELSATWSQDEHIQADQVRDVEKRYLIFTLKPLELTEFGYSHYMETNVFNKTELVVYFMNSTELAMSMKKRLSRYLCSHRNRDHTAAIFIVLTNTVLVMPHLALVYSHKGGWHGVAINIKGDGARDTVSRELVDRILMLLDDAGMSVLGDAETFFPKGKDELSADGFYFRNFPLEG